MTLRKLLIFIAAIALSSPALANVPDWLRPDIRSSLYIMPEVRDGEFVQGGITSLTATFNRNGLLEGTVGYDIKKLSLTACELVARPFAWLRVRAGIQRAPYYLEMTMSPRYQEIVGPSFACDYLGGYAHDLSGKNSRGRDCGISAEFGFFPSDGLDRLTLTAGIYNGNGYHFRDDDAFKDFQARILAQPNKSWKMSLGALIGHEKNRYSAALWYSGERFFFRTEDIAGKTGTMYSNGCNLIVGWWFRQNMALSTRVDSFFPEIRDSKTGFFRTEVCFTHMLLRKDISYRLQYGRTCHFIPESHSEGCFSICLIFSLTTKL